MLSNVENDGTKSTVPACALPESVRFLLGFHSAMPLLSGAVLIMGPEQSVHIRETT